jgi:sedoheptulokinase
VSAYTDKAFESPVLDLRPFLQGGFLLVGPELCGGRSYQVLRDFTSRVGAQVFGLSDLPDVYERLNELAASVPPGADGLRCDPVFAGSRAEPGARAEWHGMSDVNFTPGHMARALLEGLSNRFHALYAEMLCVGATRRQRLVGAGNGVRHNALLRNILATRFSMPVHVSKHTEEAATGAALCAAVAAGEFTTIHDASRRFVLEAAIS